MNAMHPSPASIITPYGQSCSIYILSHPYPRKHMQYVFHSLLNSLSPQVRNYRIILDFCSFMTDMCPKCFSQLSSPSLVSAEFKPSGTIAAPLLQIHPLALPPEGAF